MRGRTRAGGTAVRADDAELESIPFTTQVPQSSQTRQSSRINSTAAGFLATASPVTAELDEAERYAARRKRSRLNLRQDQVERYEGAPLLSDRIYDSELPESELSETADGVLMGRNKSQRQYRARETVRTRERMGEGDLNGMTGGEVVPDNGDGANAEQIHTIVDMPTRRARLRRGAEQVTEDSTSSQSQSKSTSGQPSPTKAQSVLLATELPLEDADQGLTVGSSGSSPNKAPSLVSAPSIISDLPAAEEVNAVNTALDVLDSAQDAEGTAGLLPTVILEEARLRALADESESDNKEVLGALGHSLGLELVQRKARGRGGRPSSLLRGVRGGTPLSRQGTPLPGDTKGQGRGVTESPEQRGRKLGSVRPEQPKLTLEERTRAIKTLDDIRDALEAPNSSVLHEWAAYIDNLATLRLKERETRFQTQREAYDGMLKRRQQVIWLDWASQQHNFLSQRLADIVKEQYHMARDLNHLDLDFGIRRPGKEGKNDGGDARLTGPSNLGAWVYRKYVDNPKYGLNFAPPRTSVPYHTVNIGPSPPQTAGLIPNEKSQAPVVEAGVTNDVLDQLALAGASKVERRSDVAEIEAGIIGHKSLPRTASEARHRASDAKKKHSKDGKEDEGVENDLQIKSENVDANDNDNSHLDQVRPTDQDLPENKFTAPLGDNQAVQVA